MSGLQLAIEELAIYAREQELDQPRILANLPDVSELPDMEDGIPIVRTAAIPEGTLYVMDAKQYQDAMDAFRTHVEGIHT